MDFDLQNRTFIARENSANGEVSRQTKFFYKQQKNIIWADYQGGDVLKGNLLGKVTADDKIEFNYHHVNVLGELKAGTCVSQISVLEDGRLLLSEKWQWFSGDRSSGHSQLVEI